MIIFTKNSILDVSHASEYTSGLLKLFAGKAGLQESCRPKAVNTN